LVGDVPLNPGPTTNSPAQIPSKFAPRSYNSARNKSGTLHSGPLHLGLLNCRSSVNKIALIHENDRNLDVTFLSETWFTSDTPQSMLLDLAPSGYASLHVVRPMGPGKLIRGDGLKSAAFRESVPVRVHHLASNIQLPTTFELQLLRVDAAGTGSSTPFTVVHVYRPPWMSTVSTFVDKLADIIAMIRTDCSGDILVCGNLNCPGPDDSSVDVELAECFESLGLTQLVQEPPRRLPGVANLLDVFATSNTKLVSNVAVDIADCLSDHGLITADIAVRTTKPIVNYSSRYIRSIDVTSVELCCSLNRLTRWTLTSTSSTPL